MYKLFKSSVLGSLLFFTMVSLSLAATSVTGFTDVTVSNPHYDAIMDLKTRGIISGYADNTFKPDQLVNRVEALKIILKAAKVDTSSSTVKAAFSDIDATQWYMPFLSKAVELKIVAGYADGTFKPVQVVNLAENLKMLLNADKIDVSKLQITADPYTDVLKTDWFAPYVQYAKDKKLIVADVLNKVAPAQGMTRAKLAELVYRLLNVQDNSLDYFGQVKEIIPPVLTPETPGQVAPGTPNNGVDTSLAVTIKNNSFTKADMTIAQGTLVRWTNADTGSHSVISDTGLFKSPTLANGDTWTYTFNDLGTFNYHCSLHPTMKGQIIVKPAYMVPTI